ncbi:helix-turn-helix domain-containing protein [Streptosporangium sp. NPDC001559]|uniref:helix-turn-helix domain-containing protein n=1 Tax=Streptosporangium sp. NPDC001559 TaxID=3366187 RepID=UPI0036EF2E90
MDLDLYTDAHPVADLFEGWRSPVFPLVGMTLTAAALLRFGVPLRGLQPGGIAVAGVGVPPMVQPVRSATVVHRPDSEAVRLVVMRCGCVVTDPRGDAVVDLREPSPHTNWRPWVVCALSDGPYLARGRLAVVSYTQLPLGHDLPERPTATAFPVARGVGATPADAHLRVRLDQVQAFVRDHLCDPDLTPATVAAAHHMSLRSLQRLFAGRQTTVAGLIRRLRLERCRRDLADPRLSGRPVHAIAARWGFSIPSHFTRAFRTAYGTTPTGYRAASLARSRSGATAGNLQSGPEEPDGSSGGLTTGAGGVRPPTVPGSAPRLTRVSGR